jgi:hypothetical protein
MYDYTLSERRGIGAARENENIGRRGITRGIGAAIPARRVDVVFNAIHGFLYERGMIYPWGYNIDVWR